MNTYSMTEARSRSQLTQPTRKQWTAIIPAAGKGSRLGYDKPKILFPIAGRTILDRLIDLLEPYCETIVFVLSPTGAPSVTPLARARLGSRAITAIQAVPNGMADAIAAGILYATTTNTLIMWGDQASIQPATITTLMQLHESQPESLLTLPLVERSDPYVHYQIDEHHRFVRVLERREGIAMPTIGTADCGLFAVRTSELTAQFQAVDRTATTGKSTGEWNFLPMLPGFEQGGGSVTGILLNAIEETVGINDQQDAVRVETFFRKLTQ